MPGSRVAVVLRERDSNCALRPPRGPAAFLAPGARRFVSARLLDRGEWASGLPTFEAHSLTWQVYDPGSRADAALTLDEIFEAFDRLPGRAARYPLPAMTAALRALLEPTNRPPDRRTDGPTT